MKIVIDAYSLKEYKYVKILISDKVEYTAEKLESIKGNEYLLVYLNNSYIIDNDTYDFSHKKRE